MNDPDMATLAEFVIWRLRERDLPADVAAAADRLCGRFPRPGIMGGYLEATFSVSGVPDGDDSRDDPHPWVRCFGRHDALSEADRLICHGVPYVLVQRLSRT